MISTNDFHTGLTIEFEGDIFTVVEFQHVKPGKGSAFVRSKLKNIRTGAVLDRTFRAGEKLPRAHLERKEMEYLYRSGDSFHLMDLESYEQIALSEEEMGETISYLKENGKMIVLMHGDSIVGLELPHTVELKVVETEPGFKGDTASGGTKPATLETGLVVNVPLFINTDDLLRVDTRTGEYIERA